VIFRASACAAGGPICCACSALVILLGSAFQSSNSNKGLRKFYLTRTTHTGAEALSACAGGYYMASMWEIHDPSNLRYDTELGFTRGDSGFGPPSQSPGGGQAKTLTAGFAQAGRLAQFLCRAPATVTRGQEQTSLAMLMGQLFLLTTVGIPPACA
jgi:hypothetical protein